MQESALYRKAYTLALITVVYNIIEGLMSTGLGAGDETLALFGFGLDSFIESISGFGVLLMIRRLTTHGPASRTEAEKTALRVTGYAFYALAFMLVATSVLGIYHGHVPESTQWGVIIGGISILTMWWLVHEKRKVATALNSAPLRADANCTMVCIYMSISILASSLVFELTGFAYADVLGAIAITWFSISEGRECFEKATGHECSCETECA
ncbi:MAG: cation transporter [Ignavibacteria bacterium]|jgi:divalent metal cation (Fe/Co/Zn/Cd) transporter